MTNQARDKKRTLKIFVSVQVVIHFLSKKKAFSPLSVFFSKEGESLEEIPSDKVLMDV